MTATAFTRIRLTRRGIGRLMVITGCVGLLVSIVGTIVGYQLVGQVGRSVDDSLELTTKALTSVDDSIAVTRALVVTADDGIGSIVETVQAVSDALAVSSKSTTDVQAFLSGSLPDSIDAINNVLPTIEDVAGTIDDTLKTLSRAPFGPNYDPAVPFDESIHELVVALDGLPADLRTMSADLDDVSASLVDVQAGIDDLKIALADLRTQVSDVDRLLDEYESTAAEAASLAKRSRSDLQDSERWSKLLVVLLGLVFAAGQVVPLWLGRSLMAPAEHGAVIVTRDHGDPVPLDPPAQFEHQSAATSHDVRSDGTDGPQ